MTHDCSSKRPTTSPTPPPSNPIRRRQERKSSRRIGPIRGIKQLRGSRGQSRQESALATGVTIGTAAIPRALLRVRRGTPLERNCICPYSIKARYGTVIPTLFQQFVFGPAHRGSKVLGNHDLVLPDLRGPWVPVVRYKWPSKRKRAGTTGSRSGI